MDYKDISQVGHDVMLKDVRHFELGQILDCGQAFRWAKISDTVYKGVAYGRILELEIDNNNLFLRNTDITEYETLWRNYFDLHSSYTELRQHFSEDENMQKALAFSPGLRLMRQEPWEMLISFILSQNSNIPRIKKMIEALCQSYGKQIAEGYYTFPTPGDISTLAEGDLAHIKMGYRAPYILDAARRVASGALDLQKLLSQPTDVVRDALIAVHGVGPKVADCVLLFGFGRLECFPLDVWMKRVMATLYPDGLPALFTKSAGIAQQFLFHYARVHGL